MTIPQSTPAPEFTQEEWRPVVGWEGLYEVSSFGRVRSVRRATILVHGHLNGYTTIRITVNGKRYRLRVHRLVAAAFLGPCPVGYEVNHKDFNRANPRLDNLEYMTRSENIIHCVLARRHGHSKLTVADVRAIRDSTESHRVVAKRFGVSKTNVQDIRKRRIWAHVG